MAHTCLAMAAVVMAVCTQCPCPTNDEPCTGRYEIDDVSLATKLYDASGAKVNELALHRTGCEAGLKVNVRHRDGVTMLPPGGSCILSASSPGASIWFEVDGSGPCDVHWRPTTPTPTVVLPIKVRP